MSAIPHHGSGAGLGRAGGQARHSQSSVRGSGEVAFVFYHPNREASMRDFVTLLTLQPRSQFDLERSWD